jgi:hypothetical protein
LNLGLLDLGLVHVDILPESLIEPSRGQRRPPWPVRLPELPVLLLLRVEILLALHDHEAAVLPEASNSVHDVGKVVDGALLLELVDFLLVSRWDLVTRSQLVEALR